MNEEEIAKFNKRIERLLENKIVYDWLNGKEARLSEGDQKFSNAGLIWLKQLFVEIGTSYDKFPFPYLYPTLDRGNIQAEWSVGYWEISALFVFGTRQVKFHTYNIKTNESIEHEFDFDLAYEESKKDLAEEILALKSDLPKIKVISEGSMFRLCNETSGKLELLILQIEDDGHWHDRATFNVHWLKDLQEVINTAKGVVDASAIKNK
jgi:hypothetical protein